MFKDQTALADYRLLEFPDETAQSWPIAKGERDDSPIGLLPVTRDTGQSADGVNRIARVEHDRGLSERAGRY